MKKIVFSLLCIIVITFYSHGQCTSKHMFPIEHGLSKFQATAILASLKNVAEDKESNNRLGILNAWEKPAYLKGDSVFKSSLSYDYISHDCFKGDKNELYLQFVDDNLYRIEVTLTFSKSKFQQCMENYNLLTTHFMNKFVDYTPFYSINEITNEQVSEGYNFYPVIKEKRDKIKIESLSIELSIEYELEYNNYKKEWYRTGNVDNYIIQIRYVNLKGTKLTSEGY